MTAYERYLTRQALAVEIERVQTGSRVTFRAKGCPEAISRLQSIGESEFNVLERNRTAGESIVPKHNGGNGQ